MHNVLSTPHISCTAKAAKRSSRARDRLCTGTVEDYDLLTAIFIGILKALDTFIAMHHMMVAQQSFHVIGKLEDRRRGYYHHTSSRTSNIYKCVVAIYT